MSTSEERLVQALLSVSFDLLVAICVNHGVSRSDANAIALEYFERNESDYESDCESDECL